MFRVLVFYFLTPWLSAPAQWTLTSVTHFVVRKGSIQSIQSLLRAPIILAFCWTMMGSLPKPTPSLQITFIAFHWNRGSPMWEDQGEFIDKTLWEQIDNGVPWTDTRKFLMVVPILL